LEAAHTFTEKRVNSLQNFLNGLNPSQKTLINDEIPLLQNSLEFMKTLLSTNSESLKQEEQNLAALQEEIKKDYAHKDSVLVEVRAIEEDVLAVENKNRGAIDEQKKLTLKKKDLVELIKPSELKKIEFKSHLDTSNDLFRWVISAVYKEPVANYFWENFRDEAFVSDKGEDFLLRIKGLPPRKIRKDDFIFGKKIFDRRDEILRDLEPKGKQNPSLRNLISYIGLVVEIGSYYDQIDADRELLTKLKESLRQKYHDLHRADNALRVCERKIEDTQHYIQKLQDIQSYAQGSQDLLQSRIAYLNSIKN